MPLNLAIDGKNLTGGISGISRYLAQTLKVLPKFDVNVTVLLPDEPNDIFEIPSSIEVIVDPARETTNAVNWHFSRASSLLENVPCDIFWGPAHRLPFGLNKKIKTVVTCHDLVCIYHRNTMPFKNFVSDRLQLPNAMKRADKIHAVSQQTMHDIIKTFSKFQKNIFTTLPHISGEIRGKRIKQSSKKNWGSFALFVGTFEPRKNLSRLIKAYDLMCEMTGKDPGLILAGAVGWGNVNVKETINALPKKRNISVIVSPTDTQLDSLFKQARFIILPSIFEGLGLPIIEAKNFKKPCIISGGAVSEIADKHSIIVNPYDERDIADAMQVYFFNDTIYKRVLENAINAPAKFNWEKNTELLLEAFSSIQRRY